MCLHVSISDTDLCQLKLVLSPESCQLPLMKISVRDHNVKHK